jgi:hypothetical protein
MVFRRYLCPGVLVDPAQHLDGHSAVQPHIASGVHGAVLPVAEFMLDRVVADRSGRQGADLLSALALLP